MIEIEAVFQHGQFRPLSDLTLPENLRVRLSIQPSEPADPQLWLAGVQERQRRILSRRGFYPDSATDIAEDRQR